MGDVAHPEIVKITKQVGASNCKWPEFTSQFFCNFEKNILRLHHSTQFVDVRILKCELNQTKLNEKHLNVSLQRLSRADGCYCVVECVLYANWGNSGSEVHVFCLMAQKQQLFGLVKECFSLLLWLMNWIAKSEWGALPYPRGDNDKSKRILFKPRK